MKKDEIKITDFARILIGDVPISFFIEALIRLSIVYLILIFGMRFMGKRMASQLSRNELVAIVTLAAAIGMPILSPDRGIIPAIIIAVVVVFASRWVSSYAFGHPRFEEMSQGDLGLLVQDGVLQWDEMANTRICIEKIVAFLRSQSVKHLGEVKLLYIEANGVFTLVRATKERPGLCILPDWDTDFFNKQKQSEQQVCKKCGLEKKDTTICPNCQSSEWVAAISTE